MSIGFLLICGLILVLIMLSISSPFWRKQRADESDRMLHAVEDQEMADLQVERDVLAQSLQELDDELAQGRLEPDDYERLKATDEHRLLQVLNRVQALAGQESSHSTDVATAASSRAWLNIVLPSLLVVLTSIGIYGYMQWVNMQKIVELQRQTGMESPDPQKMVARLEARLRENPDDLQGQIMAGRSYIALQRFDDAQKSWEKVLELDPRNRDGNFHIGVMLIENRQLDDPELFQKALGHFDTVLVDLPNHPGVNWYRGVSLWYLKRHRETEEAWATAFKQLDPGSQDAEFIKSALAKLRKGETPF
ncbi:MAG: c-type cytochrome biogenesis protein CcmI [Nitrospirales bacterium]|nr:c-type cytochrome biogenesis protein CcmI [Nitrospirales bacterium]